MATIEILVAEDSLTQAMKLQHFLEEQQFQVTLARDGQKALDSLEGRADDELPTLVITDVEMPDVGGYELCRRIKSSELWREIPVMLLTSLSDPGDVVKGLECGADNFVTKPYDEEFLLARIQYILTNREMRARSTPDAGLEVFFAGEKHTLDSAPGAQRTMDLLLGTYETAIQKNRELEQAKETLENQKHQLEVQSEELRHQNEVMQADLDLAKEIQQSFLPRQYPSFPHDVLPQESALHFFHRWVPTTTLGGDFFDVLAISDTKAGVFICDVMGHGVRSALVTAMMRALVGERTGMATEPGRFLQEINRHLLGILQESRAPMFASAFYMVVDTQTGLLEYSNAGHPAPLWLRRAKGELEELPGALDNSGPALGIFDWAQYEAMSLQLEERDFLMLFTDGLFEVESDGGEYGEERVYDWARRHLQLPPETLFSGLLDDVQRFSGSETFEDDMCLIGMELAKLAK